MKERNPGRLLFYPRKRTLYPAKTSKQVIDFLRRQSLRRPLLTQVEPESRRRVFAGAVSLNTLYDELAKARKEEKHEFFVVALCWGQTLSIRGSFRHMRSRRCLSAGQVNGADIRQVQSSSVEGSSTTSISAAFPSGNTAGNLIIAFVRMSTATQTVTLSDTAGNAYMKAVSQAQTMDGHQTYIFYAKNVRSSSKTVKATFLGINNHPWLAIY